MVRALAGATSGKLPMSVDGTIIERTDEQLLHLAVRPSAGRRGSSPAPLRVEDGDRVRVITTAARRSSSAPSESPRRDAGRRRSERTAPGHALAQRGRSFDTWRGTARPPTRPPRAHLYLEHATRWHEMREPDMLGSETAAASSIARSASAFASSTIPAMASYIARFASNSHSAFGLATSPIAARRLVHDGQGFLEVAGGDLDVPQVLMGHGRETPILLTRRRAATRAPRPAPPLGDSGSSRSRPRAPARATAAPGGTAPRLRWRAPPTHRVRRSRASSPGRRTQPELGPRLPDRRDRCDPAPRSRPSRECCRLRDGLAIHANSSGPMHPRPNRSSNPGEMLAVPASPMIGVAGLVESFAGELAQRFDHRVASRAVGTGLCDQHRLPDETRDRVRDSPLVEIGVAGTATAEAESNVPAKMPSRSNTVRSSASRSRYDHSTVARNVWCRSTRPRRLPVRSRNRSSRCAAMSIGLIDVTRAAASSIASGIPSTRRQISPTADHCASVHSSSAPASDVRSANSCTAALSS